MKKLWFRTVCATICLAVILGSTGLLSGLREAAAAGATRVAVVTSLKGTVQVKKAGGSKYFNAFKNMSLNEGDTITTGKNSSVVLELASSKADQDSITIGENSQVQFTKLKEDTGTKAKMSVWAGSLWVKVKSISNAEDTFEVETPTAIMGVRGTHFILAVDPVTGITTLVVASGVMAANSTHSSVTGAATGPKNVVNVYPAQQLEVDADAQTEDARALVQPADPEALVFTLPPDIIEAMVTNMADIQQENEQLAQQLASAVEQGVAAPDPNANLLLVSSDDLAAYTQNMTALVVVVLAEAVNQGVLPEETARNIVEQINEIIEDPQKKLSLDEVPEYRKDVGIDPALEAERQRAEQQRQEKERQKQEQRNAKLEQKREKAQEISETKSEYEQQNEEAKKNKKQEAYEKYAQNLSEEEKAELEQRVQEREQELQQQEQQGQQGQTGGTTSPGTGGNTGGGSTGPAISAEIVAEDFLQVMEVKLANASNVFAYQIDVEYDNDVLSFYGDKDIEFYGFGYVEDGQLNEFRNIPESPFKVELKEGWEPPTGYVVNAVDDFDDDYMGGKFRYAAMFFVEKGPNDEAGEIVKANFGQSGVVVVRLPFSVISSVKNTTTTSLKITFTLVTVDGDNNINQIVRTSELTFEVTPDNQFS
jgi:hypothetical protein